jgi:histidyl-tRNA synthetase
VRFEAPRGTHDILPSEQPLWRWLIGTAEEVCALYGYRPIATPGIEDTELFMRTSGAGSDIVRKEMYTFTDLGGRSLTLRPEATAPICRAYVQHGMHREPLPQKLYTVAALYRYDTPQKGRYREHHQLSVEAIGSNDPVLDAELVQLYTELLRRLRITGYRVQLNSIGDRTCRPVYIERLRAWLAEHDGELDEETRAKAQTSPLRVFDTKNARVAAALAGAPKIGESLCAACAEHFREVLAVLDGYGIEYELVPTLVRGLDYYTRTTFEFVGEALGAQDALVGGGRYDYLVEEIGGPPTPAIGFGAGIERLVIALGDTGVEAQPRRLDVFFVCTDKRSRLEVARVMAALRAAGVSCDMDYMGRSFNAQIKHAQRVDPRAIAVVVGMNAEIRRRGQPDRTQSLTPHSDFIEEIRRAVA